MDGAHKVNKGFSDGADDEHAELRARLARLARIAHARQGAGVLRIETKKGPIMTQLLGRLALQPLAFCLFVFPKCV